MAPLNPLFKKPGGGAVPYGEWYYSVNWYSGVPGKSMSCGNGIAHLFLGQEVPFDVAVGGRSLVPSAAPRLT
jgi:hypothetical protein